MQKNPVYDRVVNIIESPLLHFRRGVSYAPSAEVSMWRDLNVFNEVEFHLSAMVRPDSKSS